MKEIHELFNTVVAGRRQDAANALDEVWYIIQETWWEWQESGADSDRFFDEGFHKIYTYLRGLYGRDICDESGWIDKPDRDYKLSHYTADKEEIE